MGASAELSPWSRVPEAAERPSLRLGDANSAQGLQANPHYCPLRRFPQCHPPCARPLRQPPTRVPLCVSAALIRAPSGLSLTKGVSNGQAGNLSDVFVFRLTAQNRGYLGAVLVFSICRGASSWPMRPLRGYVRICSEFTARQHQLGWYALAAYAQGRRVRPYGVARSALAFLMDPFILSR